MKYFMNFILVSVLTFLTMLAFAAERPSFSDCISSAESQTADRSDSNPLAEFKSCVIHAKKTATYSQCTTRIKSSAHPEFMYLCASVQSEGSVGLCLRESASVYKADDSRLAGFAFKSCVDSFKNMGTFTECKDAIKSSDHIENMHLCTQVRTGGSLKVCFEAIGDAYKDVREQRRIRLAYQNCIDSFRRPSSYEECQTAINATPHSHLRDLCVTLPKERRKNSTTPAGVG